MPELSIGNLTEIVHDAVLLCPYIVAVGVVGSFGSGHFKHSSDVDLIVKHDQKISFDAVLESFGGYVQKVLDYQFNKRLDIVCYQMAQEKASREPRPQEAWYYREGFSKMLQEVRWVYER